MVNDLTLILLMWRKWLAPNNASRQQMGFNSGFKGLIAQVRNIPERTKVSNSSSRTIISWIFHILVFVWWQAMWTEVAFG